MEEKGKIEKKYITAEESCRVQQPQNKHAGPNKAYNNSSQKYQQIKNYIFISILKPF